MLPRYILTGFLLMCLCFSSAAQIVPKVVGAFSFEEGSGRKLIDASSALQRALAYDVMRVKGHSGKALFFEKPEAMVRIKSDKSLNLIGALTLEAWVFPTVSDEQSRIIIAKNDEYLLRMDKKSEGGNVSFFVQVGSPAVNWEPRVSSVEPLKLDMWHHLVASWDGATSRLFIDGELQGERQRPGLANPNPYPVMIGNFEYPSCHGGNFGGLIDEVKIYNYALNCSQVKQQFQEFNSD